MKVSRMRRSAAGALLRTRTRNAKWIAGIVGASLLLIYIVVFFRFYGSVPSTRSEAPEAQSVAPPFQAVSPEVHGQFIQRRRTWQDAVQPMPFPVTLPPDSLAPAVARSQLLSKDEPTTSMNSADRKLPRSRNPLDLDGDEPPSFLSIAWRRLQSDAAELSTEAREEAGWLPNPDDLLTQASLTAT